jgi:hypothetical protein
VQAEEPREGEGNSARPHLDKFFASLPGAFLAVSIHLEYYMSRLTFVSEANKVITHQLTHVWLDFCANALCIIFLICETLVSEHSKTVRTLLEKTKHLAIVEPGFKVWECFIRNVAVAVRAASHVDVLPRASVAVGYPVFFGGSCCSCLAMFAVWQNVWASCQNGEHKEIPEQMKIFLQQCGYV